MLKKKMLAVVGGSMSVIVAAATALTLAVSGPRQTQSLHSLSDNEAVSQGISNLFSSASSGVDTVKGVVDTIAANKAALTIGFNVNEYAENPQLEGMGVNVDLNCDAENNKYLIDLSAMYGSIEVIDALFYADTEELRVAVPKFIDGVIVAPYNNLVEDFENSYIGSILKEQGLDLDNYLSQYDEMIAAITEASAMMPQVDFDYEAFADGLYDAMDSAYQEAIDKMVVTDNGMQALKGGNYQSYTAQLSVAELSYIVKDAIMYCLNSEELLGLIEDTYSYMEEMQGSAYGEYDDYGDYSDIMSGYEMDLATQIQSASTMIDSYWGMILTEVEAVLGKNIEFTIYLSETVETAGFEFYASPNANGSLNYTKAAAQAAENAISLKADFTGGAKIGDYTNVAFSTLEYGKANGEIIFSFETETNGDFNLDFAVNENEYTEALVHADGSYTENGPFFDLKVNSFKIVDETGSTMFDIGFRFAFKEIDSVEKPSGSTEYNIWDMTEDDFNELFGEIAGALEMLDFDF